jgi:hypothetical protein
MAGSLLFTPTVWADYELYGKKSFTKVAEIVEKYQNPDGTFFVRAKESPDSDKVVEVLDVVKIVEVARKKGIVKPTPTIPMAAAQPAPAANAGETPSNIRKWLNLDFVYSLSHVMIMIVVCGAVFLGYKFLRSSA